MTLPSITINVPVYNEEARLPRLLTSIRNQHYPSDLVEVLVADGGSTDRSREIARSFGCRVLDNPARDQEIGKRLAGEQASGDYHIYMDADMEWSHDRCLEQLTRPLQENEALAGTFPRFVADPSDPPFNRYLSHDPLYRDALMRFLSPAIEESVVADRAGYRICEFTPERTPFIGVALLQTSSIQGLLARRGPEWRWTDIDFVLDCAQQPRCRIAYVESAGIHHRSAMSPRLYLRKLRRNVRSIYLDNVGSRDATYITWTSRRDLARLVGWCIAANLLLPGFARALVHAMRLRDPALLYEAFATTVGTDYVLWQFVADRRGRRLLGAALRAAFAPG